MLQHTTSLTRLSAIALFALSLSACESWVQLTPEGASVELVGDASRVASCTRVGRANVQTLGKIIVLERGGQRLQDELLTLARNEAAINDSGTTVSPPKSAASLRASVNSSS